MNNSQILTETLHKHAHSIERAVHSGDDIKIAETLKGISKDVLQQLAHHNLGYSGGEHKAVKCIKKELADRSNAKKITKESVDLSESVADKIKYHTNMAKKHQSAIRKAGISPFKQNWRGEFHNAHMEAEIAHKHAATYYKHKIHSLSKEESERADRLSKEANSVKESVDLSEVSQEKVRAYLKKAKDNLFYNKERKSLDPINDLNRKTRRSATAKKITDHLINKRNKGINLANKKLED